MVSPQPSSIRSFKCCNSKSYCFAVGLTRTSWKVRDKECIRSQPKANTSNSSSVNVWWHKLKDAVNVDKKSKEVTLMSQTVPRTFAHMCWAVWPASRTQIHTCHCNILNNSTKCTQSDTQVESQYLYVQKHVFAWKQKVLVEKCLNWNNNWTTAESKGPPYCLDRDDPRTLRSFRRSRQSPQRRMGHLHNPGPVQTYRRVL